MKDWPLFCDVKVNFSTSTIINSLLKLKDLSGAEITKIKRDLIFRSELLSTLCTYFFLNYPHALIVYLSTSIAILDKLQKDFTIFEVFFLVLNKSLAIIDDLEL